MENKWAYLGKVDVDTFKELSSAFPEIVGIGVDSENNIIIAVDKKHGYQAIGIYHMIVGLWDNKELIREVQNLLKRKENFMDLNLGDFVTITCEIPYGLWKNDSHTPHVKGRLGIITEVNEGKGYEDGVCFRVKDEKGDEFTYAKCELIPAFETDIRRALRELLERG